MLYVLCWFVIGVIGCYAGFYQIGRLQEKYDNEKMDRDITVSDALFIAGFGLFGPLSVTLVFVCWCVMWYNRNTDTVLFSVPKNELSTKKDDTNISTDHPLK